MMKLNERIDAMINLGHYLNSNDPKLEEVAHKAYLHNKWFTEENIRKSLSAIANEFLEKNKLNSWLEKYSLEENTNRKTIALILAGNIPMVGFHDILTSFISGNKSLLKTSSKDSVLISFLLDKLQTIDPRTAEYFQISEQIKDFDAVIATGGDSAATHFEYYFKKYPRIIRKNRNSIAILHGNESEDDIRLLARDIFDYFGLGCRNVSKIYIPRNYDIKFLMEIWHEENEIILHNKYKNNYDYNYAILMLNKENFLMNGSVLLVEDKSIVSRIACLNYEWYDQLQDLESNLTSSLNDIQCVVSKQSLSNLNSIPLGTSQNPGLSDYPDNVDIMKFLIDLQNEK